MDDKWIVLRKRNGQYEPVTSQLFDGRQAAMDFAREHIPDGVELFSSRVYGGRGDDWVVLPVGEDVPAVAPKSRPWWDRVGGTS
jgi:hypothetical protein